MTDKELWKPAKGYEGIYEISSFGHIRSMSRIDPGGYHRTGKMMKPYAQKTGYLNIKLCDANGVRHGELIHRLVAKAFVDNPNGLPDINHKDENNQNNHANNLEWCTKAYNLAYGHHREKQSASLKKNKKVIAQLRKQAIGQRKPVIQESLTGEFIAGWPSVLEASRHGYCKASISDCCKGKQRTHAGFVWRYGVARSVEDAIKIIEGD